MNIPGKGSLLSVPQEERQIQQYSEPVSIDDEEYGKKGVNSGFWYDVGV